MFNKNISAFLRVSKIYQKELEQVLTKLANHATDEFDNKLLSQHLLGKQWV